MKTHVGSYFITEISKCEKQFLVYFCLTGLQAEGETSSI